MPYCFCLLYKSQGRDGKKLNEILIYTNNCEFYVMGGITFILYLIILALNVIMGNVFHLKVI